MAFENFVRIVVHLRHTACTLALGVASAIGLAACGGGTAQKEPFVPKRLLSFGDELSALQPDGRHWGVNGFTDRNTPTTPSDTSDDTADCKALPNWVVALASQYGFVFAQCNPDNVPVPQAINLAAAGARVADVAAQIEQMAQAAPATAVQAGDLATVLVGVNDLLALYQRYPSSTEAQLIAEAGALGRSAAQNVNRLIALGARVIASNAPDMGLSPYAKAQDAAFPGAGRSGLLSRLTAAFNEQLGVTVLLDGRFLALVQLDQRTQLLALAPGSFGLTNATDAACDAALAAPPDCTTRTLVAAATAAGYLWSNDRWFAAGGQLELFNRALALALRNPF